jgi:hypothetical protein
MWRVTAAMDMISYISLWRGYTCDEDGMRFILGGVVFGVQQNGDARILYPFMCHLADKSCGRTFIIWTNNSIN